jgi:uncharacterized protein (TIGR02996 family)
MVLDALLDHIRHDPDSDDARRVYADALLDRGDLRGELIHLQLSEQPHHDRVEALLAAHGVAWLGSLRDITKRAQFRRGFVTRLELKKGIKPTAEQLADPALATVEDLLPGGVHHDVYARFVTSPAMTALRRIEVYNTQLVTALAKTPARITHVACSAQLPRDLTWFARLLRVARQRRALTSMACSPFALWQVAESAWFERVEALSLARSFEQRLDTMFRGRRIALTLQAAATLEPCGPESDPSLGAIEVAPNWEVARAWGAYGMLMISSSSVLQCLPASVKHVEVEGEPDHLDLLRRTAAFFKIEIVLSPARRRAGYVTSPSTSSRKPATPGSG